MIRITTIIFLFLSFTKVNGQNFSDLFLNINYTENIKSIFDSVEHNPKFLLYYDKNVFLESAEFAAKYIDTNHIYSNADSVVLHVITCNDMNTFFTPGAKNCKTAKVIYYLKDTLSLNEAFFRLDNLILKAIHDSNPQWEYNKKNYSLFSRYYQLTKEDSPNIFLTKHISIKHHYLTLEYWDQEK
jgi:hypothetical protein